MLLRRQCNVPSKVQADCSRYWILTKAKTGMKELHSNGWFFSTPGIRIIQAFPFACPEEPWQSLPHQSRAILFQSVIHQMYNWWVGWNVPFCRYPTPSKAKASGKQIRHVPSVPLWADPLNQMYTDNRPIAQMRLPAMKTLPDYPEFGILQSHPCWFRQSHRYPPKWTVFFLQEIQDRWARKIRPPS